MCVPALWQIKININYLFGVKFRLFYISRAHRNSEWYQQPKARSIVKSTFKAGTRVKELWSAGDENDELVYRAESKSEKN